MQLNLNIEVYEEQADHNMADRHSRATKHKLPIEVKSSGFVLASPYKLSVLRTPENESEEKAPYLQVVDLRLGDNGDDDMILRLAQQQCMGYFQPTQ